MSVFADSSALAKLYSDEPGSRLVRGLPVIVVSQLARVEVPAAIWRKHRLRQLTTTDVSILIAAFESDYFGSEAGLPRLAVITSTAGIFNDAARLAGIHGLRAYDAVQLASAQAARTADPSCKTFAAFDVALRKAAVHENFALLPKTEGWASPTEATPPPARR